MSLYKMPKFVEVKLDRLARNFLWLGQSDRSKIHPLKWSEVINLKEMEVWGWKVQRAKKWALLAKWW